MKSSLTCPLTLFLLAGCGTPGPEPGLESTASLDLEAALQRVSTADENGSTYLLEGAHAGGKQGQRAFYRGLALKDANGHVPHDAMLRARAALAVRPEFSSRTGGLDPAGWTNPGPSYGRVRALAIDPQIPLRMFAGSASGGIWRSDDGGSTWNVVDDRMGNLAVTAIVIHPTRSSEMYASTGEGFAANPFSTLQSGVRGAGVFQSLDSGSTWSRLPATDTPDFYYSNELAMSADGTTLLVATDSGVWRSFDGGVSFTRTLSRTRCRSRDVQFHPTNPSLAVAHLSDLQTGSTTAHYSTDGGASWQTATGLGDSRAVRRIEFAYHSGWTGPGNGCVYAQIESATGPVLARSVDGGATYAEVARGYAAGNQMYYNNALWIAPTPRDTNPNNDVILAGTTEFARSTDGGASFETTPFRRAGMHVDFHVIRSLPGYDGQGNRAVYVCSDGGVYLLSDIFAASSRASSLNDGLHIHQHYAGAYDVSSRQVITGGQDNGVWHLRDGQPWQFVMFGDGGFGAVDTQDGSYQYGSVQFGQVLRRRQGGAIEWISGVARSNPPTGEKAPGYIITDAKFRRSQFIAPVVMDPNDSETLLVGMVNLWRTDDARTPNDEIARTGPAWRIIKPELANRNPISAVAVEPGNSDVVYVGYSFSSGGIAKTSDATAATPSWTALGQGVLPVRHCSRIVVDPSDTNRLFVVYGGFTADNVWRSDDAGQSFQPVSSFPAIPVRDLKIHPSRSNWLYAATELGLFVSEDDGLTWTDAATPADVAIFELNLEGDQMHCFTHGRGVFQQQIDAADPAPDLHVVSVATSASGTTWDGTGRYPIAITLENRGSVAAPGGALAILLSSDDQLSVQDDLLETRGFPALGAGQRTTLNVAFGTPACWNRTGNHFVGVLVDPANRIQEADESNNAGVIRPARRLVDYSGPSRYLEYLDPRFENQSGPAWRRYATWEGAQGVSMNLCAFAPQSPGMQCVAFLSLSPTPAIDPLTSLGLQLSIFSPTFATLDANGRALITQSFPPVPVTRDAQIYVHTAWFTPQFALTGFGDNSLTNLLRR